jgi:hypothetical protein
LRSIPCRVGLVDAKVLTATLMLSAIAYTLIVAAMVWFTIAFIGFDTERGDVGGLIGLSLFAMRHLHPYRLAGDLNVRGLERHPT